MYPWYKYIWQAAFCSLCLLQTACQQSSDTAAFGSGMTPADKPGKESYHIEESFYNPMPSSRIRTFPVDPEEFRSDRIYRTATWRDFPPVFYYVPPAGKNVLPQSHPQTGLDSTGISPERP